MRQYGAHLDWFGGSQTDRAAVVWQLAVDSGLTGAVADDVCFVTLQGRSHNERRSLHFTEARAFVLAALEQRAVALCLAARGHS